MNATMKIYNLKETEENRDIRFESYRWASKYGIRKDRYEEVWSEEITLTNEEEITRFLEDQFVRFNTDRPENFRGHNMSMSDVIGITTEDETRYFYVDTIGFKEMTEWAA